MRILIYQQFRNGDVIQTSFIPFLIKRKFPESQVVFACNPESHYLLKDHPAIDQIIDVPEELKYKTDKPFYQGFDLVIYAWVGYSPTFSFAQNRYENLLTHYESLLNLQLNKAGYGPILFDRIRPYVPEPSDERKAQLNGVNFLKEVYSEETTNVIIQDECLSQQSLLRPEEIRKHIEDILNPFKNKVTLWSNNKFDLFPTISLRQFNLVDVKYIIDSMNFKLFFHTDSSFTNLLVANKPEKITSFSFSEKPVGIREYFDDYTGESYNIDTTMNVGKCHDIIRKIVNV